MRWDGDGDDGPGDGDDVDDDPDDARRDGDDDDDDSPIREGNSPSNFSLSELFFSLSRFRLVEAVEKLLVDSPDVFRSMGGNTPKGSRRGATGTRDGSHPRPGVGPLQGLAPAPWSSSPCPFSAP